MRRSRSIVGVGILVIAVTLVAGAVRSPAATTSASQACGTFAGTGWEDLVKGVKGTKWKIVAVGVPCSFAKTWAVKLSKPNYKGQPAGAIKGPAGWQCYSAIDVAGGTPGMCRKGLKVHFAWGYTSQTVK